MPATKKTNTAKAKPKESPADAVARQIIDAVKSGKFDGYLERFDDAVTDRINAGIAEREKTERAASRPAKTETKTVAPPPRKPSPAKGAAKVTPVKDGRYIVAGSFNKLAGAEVEFIRHKDGDTTKSVISMITAMPGNPKGKRVVVPTNALEMKPAEKKSASARKVVRKK